MICVTPRMQPNGIFGSREFYGNLIRTKFKFYEFDISHVTEKDSRLSILGGREDQLLIGILGKAELEPRRIEGDTASRDIASVGGEQS